MYDFTLNSSLWFNSIKTDCLAHKVARELIARNGSETYGQFLTLTRRVARVARSIKRNERN